MEKVRIRAKSEIKLVAESGLQMTTTYPKECKVETMLEDILFAEFKNKGSENLKKFCNDLIDQFTDKEHEKSA